MKDWKQLYKRPEEDDPLTYNETVLDHFQNPRNVGRVERYDGIGTYGDPSCGDYMELTIKVDEVSDRIVEARYLVYGCAGVISTSSMMTEIAIGKTIQEALSLTDEDVVSALGGLPEEKRHCSLLGVQALHRAILDCLVMRDMIRKGAVSGRAEYRKLRAEGAVDSMSHVCDGSCEADVEKGSGS